MSAAGPLRARIDQVLGLDPDYNLRSRHPIGFRDAPIARAWLPRSDPRWRIFLRLVRGKVCCRKELYESLFVIDRLAPQLARATMLVDVAAGHGMLAMFAAILHRNLRRVVCIDKTKPKSHEVLLERLSLDEPWLKTRLTYLERPIGGLRVPSNALVVGVHCCGALTDEVAGMAARSGAPFAVVPCCEPRALLPPDERARVPGQRIPEAVNARRLQAWRASGYEVSEAALPLAVTARPRVFFATR